MRFVYLIIGLILVPIGIVGVVLPGLPGTIFLILAAACFARSSPRFEQWLVNHKFLGPGIVAWRERGAISRKSKTIAISVMALSGALTVLSSAPAFAKAIAALSLIGAAVFVGTRPDH